MSTDIIYSKAQLTKIIAWAGFLDNKIVQLAKKHWINLAVSLAKDVFPELATKLTSSTLDKFERKISARQAVRSGKVFTLFLLNKNMDD